MTFLCALFMSIDGDTKFGSFLMKFDENFCFAFKILGYQMLCGKSSTKSIVTADQSIKKHTAKLVYNTILTLKSTWPQQNVQIFTTTEAPRSSILVFIIKRPLLTTWCATLISLLIIMIRSNIKRGLPFYLLHAAHDITHDYGLV